jgi:hypothetical protein
MSGGNGNDPLVDAIEAMQIGSAEEGAAALRKVLDAHDASRAVQQQRSRDYEMSNAHLQKFLQEHPELGSNRHLQSMVEREIYEQQLGDLREAGFDVDKARADAGRDPLPSEIANLHQQLRMGGHPKARDFGRLLFDAASEAGRGIGQDLLRRPRSRSEIVREQMRQQAARRGIRRPELDAPVDRGQVDEGRSLAEETERSFGDLFHSESEPAGAPQSRQMSRDVRPPAWADQGGGDGDELAAARARRFQDLAGPRRRARGFFERGSR